jgi:hypothetical protein
MKRFWPWLIVIFVIALGLWARSTLPAYASPEQAARQYWTRLNQDAPSPIVGFQVLDQRVLGARVLVLSSYSLARGSEAIQNVSYAFVRNGPFGWYVGHAQSVGKSPLPDRVLYAVDRKDGEQLAYGRILSTDVAAVEVLFENGETRREAGSNGVFAILFPPGRQFAELRLVGQQGEILQRYSQLSSLE